jgi:hypothetical protein
MIRWTPSGVAPGRPAAQRAQHARVDDRAGASSRHVVRARRRRRGRHGCARGARGVAVRGVGENVRERGQLRSAAMARRACARRRARRRSARAWVRRARRPGVPLERRAPSGARLGERQIGHQGARPRAGPPTVLGSQDAAHRAGVPAGRAATRVQREQRGAGLQRGSGDPSGTPCRSRASAARARGSAGRRRRRGHGARRRLGWAPDAEADLAHDVRPDVRSRRRARGGGAGGRGASPSRGRARRRPACPAAGRRRWRTAPPPADDERQAMTASARCTPRTRPLRRNASCNRSRIARSRGIIAPHHAPPRGRRRR